MSTERKIIDELNKVLTSIRYAEKEIVGTEYGGKIDIVEKLASIEQNVIDIRSSIKLPELVIDENTELYDLRDENVLSVRACNCLMRYGCKTIGDVTKLTKDELMSIRNMGRKPVEEVLELLQTNGFSLKEDAGHE